MLWRCAHKMCSSLTWETQEGRIMNGLKEELDKFIKDSILDGIVWVQPSAQSLNY